MDGIESADDDSEEDSDEDPRVRAVKRYRGESSSDGSDHGPGHRRVKKLLRENEATILGDLIRARLDSEWEYYRSLHDPRRPALPRPRALLELDLIRARRAAAAARNSAHSRISPDVRQNQSHDSMNISPGETHGTIAGASPLAPRHEGRSTHALFV